MGGASNFHLLGVGAEKSSLYRLGFLGFDAYLLIIKRGGFNKGAESHLTVRKGATILFLSSSDQDKWVGSFRPPIYAILCLRSVRQKKAEKTNK